MADGSFVVSDSDAELLGKSFRIDDPESLPDLVHKIPSSIGLPIIEHRYDVSPGEGNERDYVFCAHCEKPTHWKGYVISIGEDRRALIGHCCGKKQFGFDFGKVENTFNRQADRQAYLNRIILATPRLLGLRKCIYDLNQLGAIQTLDKVRAEARLNWRDFETKLSASVINENYLIADYEELDTAEYEREKASIERYYDRRLSGRLPIEQRQSLKNERARKIRELKPKRVFRRKNIGAINGISFIESCSDTQARINLLSQNLLGLYARLTSQKSHTISDKELRTIWKDIKKICHEITALCELVRDADSFFQMDNINKISMWAEIVLPEQNITCAENEIIANPSGVSPIMLGFKAPENTASALNAVKLAVEHILSSK